MEYLNEQSLHQQFTSLQLQLFEMFSKKQSFIDPEVVAISQELDWIVLQLQKKMI